MKRTLVGAAAMFALSCSQVRPASDLETQYDKDTGKLRGIAISKQKDGNPDIFSYMDGAKFLRIEIDNNEDGQIDRWEYYSDSQKLDKVEVSTKGDGRRNRVEFYEAGILTRAEEDTNADGRADKWETYAKGNLSKVAFDTQGTGTPNHVIDYEKEESAP